MSYLSYIVMLKIENAFTVTFYKPQHFQNYRFRAQQPQFSMLQKCEGESSVSMFHVNSLSIYLVTAIFHRTKCQILDHPQMMYFYQELVPDMSFSLGIHNSNSRHNILLWGIKCSENQLRALFAPKLNSECFQLERQSVCEDSWMINKTKHNKKTKSNLHAFSIVQLWKSLILTSDRFVYVKNTSYWSILNLLRFCSY